MEELSKGATLIQNRCRNELIKMFAQLDTPIGIKNDEDIIENLGALAITSKNETLDRSESTFVPLKIKKMVFHLLYPNGSWVVSEPMHLKNLAHMWSVNVKIYADTTKFNPMPIAEENIIFPAFFISEEMAKEKEKSITELVSVKLQTMRGWALSRAFGSVGIGFIENEFIETEPINSEAEVYKADETVDFSDFFSSNSLELNI